MSVREAPRRSSSNAEGIELNRAVAWKHPVLARRVGPRDRLPGYAIGAIVGVVSYLAWHWINNIEFMGGPDDLKAVTMPILHILRAHPLSFVLWLTACFLAGPALFSLMAYRRRYTWMIEQGANLDGLTGVCGHRLLHDGLETETARANRYNRPLSIVMLNLDDFKSINERQGHHDGDETLRSFAQQLLASTRSVDIVARYGGDEFVIVLPETSAEGAVHMAERIRSDVERGIEAGPARGTPRCTVSAGIAQLDPERPTRHALLLAADIALCSAKRNGKNQVCVYSAGLQETYRTSSARLRSMLASEDFGAIEALSAAVDAKDERTKGHSDAVMRYALSLGRRLGLSESELENLKAAALLHDIGKIGMPDAILNKPGALEEDERRIIESHPDVGSHILEKVQRLGPIVPAVKYHHERYDGAGYPNGLVGDNIPLFARIIALADAFDAMISDRTYRKALDIDVALREIVECSGTQFDPELVQLFADVVMNELVPKPHREAA